MSSMRRDDPRLQRHILTPTEKEGLNRQLGRIEADKRGDLEGVPRRLRGALYNHPDRQANVLDDDERRIKRVLAQGGRDSLSEGDKVQMESVAKKLKESLA